MTELVQGLLIHGEKVKFATGDYVYELDLSPDELRGFAVAMALLADRLEGRQSPPIARFLGDEMAGSA
ncbi:MAG: hypothetical protein JJ913_08095 [Rhizobiaceae bacterium]|nr:hypothetical protein [Rhizobiaceae bacterium]